jgi:hypothetical protein
MKNYSKTCYGPFVIRQRPYNFTRCNLLKNSNMETCEVLLLVPSQAEHQGDVR